MYQMLRYIIIVLHSCLRTRKGDGDAMRDNRNGIYGTECRILVIVDDGAQGG